MSAPEPGTVGDENLGLQKQPLPPLQTAANNHPLIHPMQLSSYTVDGTAVYKPVTGNSAPPYSVRPAGNGNGAPGAGEGINMNMGISGVGGGDGGGVGGEQAKKRRGRPRKYGPEGATAVPVNSAPPVIGGFLSSQPQQQPQFQQQQQQQFAPQLQQQQQQQQPQQQGVVQGGGGAPESAAKRRGRPPGSINKKQHQQPQQQQQQRIDALGAPGIGFTPHVITVNAGEDVSTKIMSFSQNGPRAICILSANGTIQSVALRQASTSGGSVTYEGRYEILSLSGSFMLSENGGGRSRTGGLSVSLAGPDGRVLGGGVAGLLTAASPVQVVVGSFIADGRRELKSPNQSEPLFTPSRLHSVPVPQGANSPPSHGTLSESSGGAGSPLHQSAVAVNSTPPGMSNLPWK